MRKKIVFTNSSSMLNYAIIYWSLELTSGGFRISEREGHPCSRPGLGGALEANFYIFRLKFVILPTFFPPWNTYTYVRTPWTPLP